MVSEPDKLVNVCNCQKQRPSITSEGNSERIRALQDSAQAEGVLMFSWKSFTLYTVLTFWDSYIRNKIRHIHQIPVALMDNVNRLELDEFNLA